MATGLCSSNDPSEDEVMHHYGYPEAIIQVGQYVIMAYDNELEGGVDLSIYQQGQFGPDGFLQLQETITITEA